jgi:histidinol-phosphatase (PHP family)
MEKVKETLEVIRRRGVPVEINTGGITRNVTDDFYPSLPIIRECRRLEIPILINSDSHNPDHLDGAFEEARRAALEEGYRERLVLADGGWKSISL